MSHSRASLANDREEWMLRCSIQHPEDCWEWRWAKRTGYGLIFHTQAHRWVYEKLVGPIQDLYLHHKCENKSCCNPAHMQVVTRSEHARIHNYVDNLRH